MKYILSFLLCFLSICAFCEIIDFETQSFKYKIDTDKGGHIVSMVDSNNKEWLNNGFLLGDMALEQSYKEADLLNKKYNIEEKNTNSISLSATLEKAVEKNIIGVKFTKNINFSKDSDIITVKYILNNPTNENKNISLWIQNIVFPNDTKLQTVFRPSVDGTMEMEYPPKVPTNNDLDCLFNFTQGFNSVLDCENKTGLIFLLDYNTLKCIYACYGAYTQEWWYDPCFLKPGKSFETEIKLMPFVGLDRVDFANEDFIMAKYVQRDGKKAQIKLDILSQKENQKAKIIVKKFPQMKVLGEKDFIINKNTKADLSIENSDASYDLIFEVIFPNDTFQVFSKGVAPVLGSETNYKLVPKRKIKHIDKPVFTKRKINDKLNVLQAMGLFSGTFKFDRVCEKFDYDYKASYYSATDKGYNLAYFPDNYNYDEIFTYDLIILNHLPYNAFDEFRLDFLRDYVVNGGKIMFIGGPMCIWGYDKDNDFSKILLPFTYDKLSKKVRHEEGMPIENIGLCEYEVPIKTSDKIAPYLYKYKFGQGGLYFFTPTVLSQNLEEKAFWNSPDYIDFMGNLINTIVREK